MTLQPIHLVLASRSPRRRELLASAGYRFEVIPPEESAECGVCSGETPAEMVARLACQKAANVARQIENDNTSTMQAWGPLAAPAVTNGTRSAPARMAPAPSSVVIGCDTIAECDGQILGKPAHEEHARAMLKILSGREHRVLSGLCLWPVPDGQPMVRVAVTRLKMDVLGGRQLDEYLASGQWEGKAGAFGYQDGLDWVHVIEGSESNVVGLPMELLAEMLEAYPD